MNKLWNMLHGNLMNGEGGDGGQGGGGAAPGGNPLGNAGQADYLNGGEGDQSGNNQGGNGGTNGAAAPAGNGGESSDSGTGGDNGAGDGGDGDNKGLGGDGLLDDVGDKPAEGEEKPAPSDADFTFEMPEGFTLDESVQADIVKIAKEHNVSPEAAKVFVQKHAELKQAELATARQTIQEWKEATAADPEIGGEYLQQTMRNVKNALNAPGGAEVTEILKQTGLQNHPAFIKFLNAYGKINRNDSNRGGNPSTVVSDQQKIEAFYGTGSK